MSFKKFKKAVKSVAKVAAPVVKAVSKPVQKVAAPIVKAAAKPLQKGIGALSLPTSLAAKVSNRLGVRGYLGKNINKGAASSKKLTNKGGALANHWARDYSDALKRGDGLDPSTVNKTFQDGRRAHIRTNTPQMLQQGLASGQFQRGADGGITDRFGQSVQGKGLGQRGADIINYASIAMPALAPIAAGANFMQGVSQGRPVGKSLAQAGVQYGAGRFGAQAGAPGSLASAAGRGAASGAANAGVSGYNQGMRGGELFREAGKGGAIGGVVGGVAGHYAPRAFAGMTESGVAAPLARGVTSGATGALSAGLRGGNMAEGFVGGAVTGGAGQQWGNAGAGAARGAFAAYQADQKRKDWQNARRQRAATRIAPTRRTA